MAERIPGPWPLPFIGNLWDLDPSNSIRDMADLADMYGPIYKLRFAGEDRLVVTNQELVNEVCTRREFDKYPLGFLKQLRDVVGEGLFTAYPDQESWGIAHRTLSPAFGSVSVKNMFPVQDFTRLTVDTIALCAMDTGLNSFYTEQVPSYIQAMYGLLREAQLRTYRPWWLAPFMREANRKFDENNKIIHSVAEEVISQRRSSADPQKKDLVDAMLNGVDPKTGKSLTDETITLQNEIDQVIGTEPVTADHLKDLSYTKACIWKTLRLQPPSGVWTVTCMESDAPVMLANKWEVKPVQTILVVNPKLHRDPSVWGEDANEFKPERMLGDKMSKLPRNCLKPFGNGQRACIGRAFAFQEATLAVALLFQKFNFELADPDYQISVKEALALKPHDYFIYAKLRPGVDIISLQTDMFPRSGSARDKESF
ncbi:cytochrome P450 [Nemania abortiva]|nr:cytochrome P450 [Nemania abortiva]